MLFGPKNTWFTRGPKSIAEMGVASVALTLCLALMTLGLSIPNDVGSKLFVAELRRSAATKAEFEGRAAVGFIVRINLKNRELTVEPVDAPFVENHSYHLWLLPQGTTLPIFLGIISPAAPKSIAWPFSNTLGDLTNATLEVSLEPADSPTGQRPTGRILFLGRLFAS